ICASASVSLSARPRSSGAFCRIEDGSVSPISRLRLLAPTVSGIASTSLGEGPMCRRAKVAAASLLCLKGAFMGFPLYPPSCPAKAGHPVRRGLSAQSLTSRRTGSPGQALRYAHIFWSSVSTDKKRESFQRSLTNRAQGVSESGGHLSPCIRVGFRDV